MAISTYSELQSAVTSYAGRSDAAFTALIPTFIKLGEAEINKRARLLQQETSAPVSLASGARTANLPAGFLEIINLRFDADDYIPTHLTLSDLTRYRATEARRPRYFAVSAAFEFEALADAAYALTARHYKKWDIATDTTNWLITNFPDVYLHSALMKAAEWARNADLMALHARAFQLAFDDLTDLQQRNKGFATMRVDNAITRMRRRDYGGDLS